MTREVVGLEPAPGPSGPSAEFDLGELTPVGAQPTGQLTPRPTLTGRLRTSARPWPVLAIASVVAAVAAFAGWHAGADRRQSALDAAAAAHPGIFAWIVDGGPTLASAPDDPRVEVDLHVTNLGPVPVQIRSISITTDRANASVSFDGYTPSPIAPDDNAIVQLVARPQCTSSYEGAFLSVLVTRMAADGSSRVVRVPAGADGRIGDTLASILNRTCVYPTRDDPASGVAGLVIDQSSGADGATLRIANRSNGSRQVRVVADDGPAFQLVSSLPGAKQLAPGEVVEVHLRVHVLDCGATYGLQDWAHSVVLNVTSTAGPLAPGAPDVTTAYDVPDLMLVPGGAAIQRACG